MGYGTDQISMSMSSKQESLMSFFCLIQCILLGSFAAILGAHRSEILDKPGGVNFTESADVSDTYDQPYSSS
jgi:hypothetical protein